MNWKGIRNLIVDELNNCRTEDKFQEKMTDLSQSWIDSLHEMLEEIEKENDC